MHDPILPSSLLQQTEDTEFNLHNKIFNNVCLRHGVVLECFDIEDEGNISKKVPEYTVMVIEQEQDGGINTSLYKNCVTIQSFGGIGDFFEFKLRASSKAQDTYKKGTLNSLPNDGSLVTILCLDGNAEKGIIVGSIAHPSRKTKLTKVAGQHAEGEYNGINWQINKEGEFQVTFKSKTDNKGIPQDSKSGGTYFKIDKTGSVAINDAVGDSISIDKPNQTVNINAAKNISVTAKENISLNSVKNTSISCADLLASASGAAGINVGKDLTATIKSALTCKAQSITLQSDSLLNLQGSTITVKGEQVAIKGTKIELGEGATPAVTSMTQFLGFAGPIPVVSTALGPFSAIVSIA